MSVLSIQSHVAAGHVGNSAAVLALQVLGHEVWPVHTVLYSNHPGHGTWRGAAVDAADIAATLDSLAELGLYAECRAVLTGYLGTAAAGEAAAAAWAAVRDARPDVLICCDPVIGDRDEGVYVADELLAFYRARAGAADVLFPNVFELELLSGRPAADPAGVAAASRVLLEQGAGAVVATSVASAADIGVMLVDAGGAWLVSAPRLALRAKGAGDFFTALWLGHYLRSGDRRDALGAAFAGTYAAVEASVAGNSRELPLVAARPAWEAPPRLFNVAQIE